jgi:hypothetical protein
MMKNDLFLEKPGFVIKDPLSTGGELGFLRSISLSITGAASDSESPDIRSYVLYNTDDMSIRPVCFGVFSAYLHSVPIWRGSCHRISFRYLVSGIKRIINW